MTFSISRKTLKRVIIGGLVALVVLGTALGFTLTRSKGGFYNMSTLEQSVQQQVDSRGVSGTVEGCSIVSGNTAQCQVLLGDGTDQGLTITISADGNSWVSN